MSSLENRTRHNIPLDIALKAMAANGEIPVNLNNLLDTHHYVMVPVLTTLIITLIIAAAAVFIRRMRREAIAVAQTVSYQMALLISMQENMRRLGHIAEEHGHLALDARETNRPRTMAAPLPMTEKPPCTCAATVRRSLRPRSSRALIGSAAITGREHARTCSSGHRTLTRNASPISGKPARVQDHEGPAPRHEFPAGSTGPNVDQHENNDGAPVRRKENKEQDDKNDASR